MIERFLSNFNITEFIYSIIAIYAAVVPHEIAHGYAAYLLGDNTAKREGRLSFNPLNHIDPVGLLSMLVLKIGWAKPVPVNPENFKGNKRVDDIIVSLAGVFVNFVIGLVAAILFVFCILKDLEIKELFELILWYNVMLGVFNLVPIFPLDGSKVVLDFLPTKVTYWCYRNENIFFILLLFLLFSGAISKIIFPAIYFLMDLFINIGISIL